MNCRRVEKLIPLYVEGDLAFGLADRITSHIEWCGRCNWLADEYKESQSWLRSSEPPEFDDAALNGLKVGVLRQIAETSSAPSLLASLMQQWSRRQVLALSAAMLIIFGVVVFYVYQTRSHVNPQVVEAVKEPADTESPPSQQKATDTGPATGAGLGGPHRNSLASAKPRAEIKRISDAKTIEPPFVSIASMPEEVGTAAAQTADKLPREGDDPPGKLRIEIQTSDPNIRIIWFAPREVESPQTNQ